MAGFDHAYLLSKSFRQLNLMVSRLVDSCLPYRPSRQTQVREKYVRQIRRIVFGILACLVLASGVVWAQSSTAQVSGIVNDQTGAVLPGVEITVTQTETGITRTTITNETGSYVLPNLAVGPYRLEASLPGFRTFVQTGIVLQVNASPVINPVLEIGQVSEQVEVQANAALVETRNLGVGQVIENERILELPLNGRQVTDLIVLSGAAVQTGTNSTRSMQGVPLISLAGGLSTASGGATYTLDGAMHNDPTGNSTLPLPFPDALQEFKVETGVLPAQTGMHSAGLVSAVTKSGTNDLHGDLFEFVRNDLFNARNYFATTQSTLKRNQFGGTLGGPIMRNKLFFFSGYQGTTTRQDPANNIKFVPTAAMMSGDWSAFASPACNAGRQITLRVPFVNNQVNPALYSRAAVAIANKLPKTSDPCGKAVYGSRNIVNDHQAVGKIDYQVTANHSVFGRYVAESYKNPHPYTFSPDNLLNATGQGFDNLAQSFAIGDTYLINPNTVNSFRAVANRTATKRSVAEFFSAPDVGINAYSYLPKLMSMTISGGFSLGGNLATFRTTTFAGSDDLSVVKGTHQISFGASLAHWRTNGNPHQLDPGSYTFNGQDTGLGMGDFLLGKLSRFAQAAPNVLYTDKWYFGMYGQDTWKATPALTLNYGLRWEPFFPTVYPNGIVDNFDYDRFRQGIKSTIYKNAPAGFYYPGDPGFPGKAGSHKAWAHFAPRVGFAWDPSGDGRTSIRSGFSIAFDTGVADANNTMSNASPWGQNVTIDSPAGGFDNPWQGVQGGNPFPVRPGDPNAPYSSYGSFSSVNYDFHTTYVEAWTLSIQHQFAADWLASASYLGNQAVHVYTQAPLNPAIYFPGGPCTINGVTYNPCSTTANTNQRRRLGLERPQDAPFLGPIMEADSGANQTYHGLLLSLQRRASRGVTISGNYTWSHCIGIPLGESGDTYVRLYDRESERSNCKSTRSDSVDRRQVFNLTAVIETPQFANSRLRALASGWRFSGIYRRSTGTYLTVLSGLDRALSGVTTQRPDQVLANVYGDKSLNNYLNPAAFAQPALGTYGNMRPANIVGPASWQLDVALSRMFRIREAQRLELRAEAFSVTNSLRMGNPNVTLNTNTFGQITTASDPRILQFALKYVF